MLSFTKLITSSRSQAGSVPDTLIWERAPALVDRSRYKWQQNRGTHSLVVGVGLSGCPGNRRKEFVMSRQVICGKQALKAGTGRVDHRRAGRKITMDSLACCRAQSDRVKVQILYAG